MFSDEKTFKWWRLIQRRRRLRRTFMTSVFGNFDDSNCRATASAAATAVAAAVAELSVTTIEVIN